MCFKLTLPILLLVALAVVSAQNDGRYRAPPTALPRYRIPITAPPRVPDGRYRAGNDGRYRGGSDGRYRGGNDGKYVHQDVKYVHQDRPGGAYTGDSGAYRPDANRFGPGGGGAGANGGAVNANGGAGNANGGAGNANGAGAVIPVNAFVNTAAVRPAARPPPPAAVNIGANLPQGRGTGEGGNGWRIIRLEDKVEEDGYHYLYETENGILSEENGRIEQLNPNDAGLRSAGFYEYTGDDGALYRVDYVADDRGFVPQGAHIPATPPHVIKLLAYLDANAPKRK